MVLLDFVIFFYFIFGFFTEITIYPPPSLTLVNIFLAFLPLLCIMNIGFNTCCSQLFPYLIQQKETNLNDF